MILPGLSICYFVAGCPSNNFQALKRSATPLDNLEHLAYNESRQRDDKAHSSSGLGRRPLKAEITGSNPVCATICPFLIASARSRSGLRRFCLFKFVSLLWGAQQFEFGSLRRPVQQ